MLSLTYLLPIRLGVPPPLELTRYLAELSRHCRVIVVDGSNQEIFWRAHDAWADFVVHVRPDGQRACANGKVHGVLSGMVFVDTPFVVIADDDVRYTRAGLDAILVALADCDLVVPQNYFSPVPWHAHWDTARTLLNRITGGDLPGTLALRMGPLRAAGGYDGDVLFENLELIRTIEAVGGSCRWRPDIYVQRRPPTTRHFLGQRVRQAYDEFARPVRMLPALAALPVAILVGSRHPTWLAAAAPAMVLAAEVGRHRHDGRRHFSRWSSLFAPLWVAERAICAWLAVGMRAMGGVPYAGERLQRAANGSTWLRRRHRGRALDGPPPGVTAPWCHPSRQAHRCDQRHRSRHRGYRQGASRPPPGSIEPDSDEH